MKKNSQPGALLQARYDRLAATLAQPGFITQGSVFERPQGSIGSPYQWTWKDPRQKTRSLSLSKAQFDWLQRAVKNQRRLEKTLRLMRRISHRFLLQHVPGIKRPNPVTLSSLHLK